MHNIATKYIGLSIKTDSNTELLSKRFDKYKTIFLSNVLLIVNYLQPIKNPFQNNLDLSSHHPRTRHILQSLNVKIRMKFSNNVDFIDLHQIKINCV